jgi:hypothetical protein
MVDTGRSIHILCFLTRDYEPIQRLWQTRRFYDFLLEPTQRLPPTARPFSFRFLTSNISGSYCGAAGRRANGTLPIMDTPEIINSLIFTFYCLNSLTDISIPSPNLLPCTRPPLSLIYDTSLYA